jgi:hypothetical protein
MIENQPLIDIKNNLKRFVTLMNTAQRFYNANPSHTPSNQMDISRTV